MIGFRSIEDREHQCFLPVNWLSVALHSYRTNDRLRIPAALQPLRPTSSQQIALFYLEVHKDFFQRLRLTQSDSSAHVVRLDVTPRRDARCLHYLPTRLHCLSMKVGHSDLLAFRIQAPAQLSVLGGYASGAGVRVAFQCLDAAEAEEERSGRIASICAQCKVSVPVRHTSVSV